jgi:hypothetical protein
MSQTILAAVIVGRQMAPHALLKKCASLSAIVVLLSSGLGCISCASAPSHFCCRTRRTDGSKAIYSSISVKSEGHGCSRETENDGSKKRCCLRGTQPKSTATLQQTVDYPETPSNSDWQRPAFGNERLQGPPTAPVMNRGSTYLELCVLTI